jgi:spermidine synthase
VYYGDGIGGFTTVLRYADSLGNIYYSMMNSGKADASSRADMTTQTLSAHFPMLFHPSPKTVMVLGLASGVTAGEVLYYPIERLDVVDINREVVAGSDFFIPWNNDVLSNPKTDLIIQDGRAHLQLTKRKYDVITSEPSNPWMAGLSALFTRDFFELAKDRLNEEGIYVQFIHAYQMDWSTFALVGRTFAEVFPNSLLVATEPHTLGYDYLLVGLKGRSRLSLDSARRNLPYAQQSKNVTIQDHRLLYRLIITEDLRKLFGEGPVNTDSWPRLEFAAPKLMYFYDPMIGKNVLSKKWRSSRTRSIIRQVATDVDRQIDFAVYALSVYQPFGGMVDLSRATPLQKRRYFELVETYCASNSIDYSLFRDDELKRRCGSLQIKELEKKIDVMPNKAASHLYLANLYYTKGMPDEAIANYYKSLEISPYSAEAHSNLGAVLVQQGQIEKAIEHLTEALEITPGNAPAHNNLGYALMQQEEWDKAIKHFSEALRIAPNFALARRGLEKARLMQKRGR